MSGADRLERKLHDALGMKVRDGTRPRLERELKRLQQEQNLDFEAVLQRLDVDPRLVRRLASALTVEETFFLRHPEHFALLVQHVRARLDETAESLAVWSAGCSTGEEPYSMAIAIHRALGAEALSRTSILATDVDATSLERAQRAAYNIWSFRGTSPRALSLYLEPGMNSDLYRLTPAIRAAVHFAHLSLQEQLARLLPASLDAIFFRNVAIYLTEDATQSLYAGFARVLKEGGLLVLGPSDPRPRPDAFVRRPTHGTLAHYKTAQRPHAAPQGPHQTVAQLSESPQPTSSVASRYAPKSAASPQLSAANRQAQRTAILVEAHRLADRGLASEALAKLSEELERSGCRPDLLSLRGRIRLSEGDAERGAEDLKTAVDLAPTDPTLRFHYALALEVLHQSGACRAQVQTLLRSLEPRSDAEALAPEALAALEEAISVRSLRQAAHELLRRVE